MNPILMALIVKIVELSLPYAEDAFARGLRPETLTLENLYGRDTSTLRAEVDAEERPSP